MKEIVEKTGLSKGAFYHHFSSKEILFKEIVLMFFAMGGAKKLDDLRVIQPKTTGNKDPNWLVIEKIVSTMYVIYAYLTKSLAISLRGIPLTDSSLVARSTKPAYILFSFSWWTRWTSVL